MVENITKIGRIEASEHKANHYLQRVSKTIKIKIITFPTYLIFPSGQTIVVDRDMSLFFLSLLMLAYQYVKRNFSVIILTTFMDF